MDFGRPRKFSSQFSSIAAASIASFRSRPDFVGKVVPTKQTEIIKVMLKEFDDVEAVGIFERPT
jgi:pyrimidine operon attenuation protein/uracil phosphoribosyltransferase